MMAMWTKAAEWALEPEEAEALADASGKVLRHYPKLAGSVPAKVVDWGNLAMVVGGVYGTRIFAIRARLKEERAAKGGAPPKPFSPPQSAAPPAPIVQPAPGPQQMQAPGPQPQPSPQMGTPQPPPFKTNGRMPTGPPLTADDLTKAAAALNLTDPRKITF